MKTFWNVYKEDLLCYSINNPKVCDWSNGKRQIKRTEQNKHRESSWKFFDFSTLNFHVSFLCISVDSHFERKEADRSEKENSRNKHTTFSRIRAESIQRLVSFKVRGILWHCRVYISKRRFASLFYRASYFFTYLIWR